MYHWSHLFCLFLFFPSSWVAPWWKVQIFVQAPESSCTYLDRLEKEGWSTLPSSTGNQVWCYLLIRLLCGWWQQLNLPKTRRWEHQIQWAISTRRKGLRWEREKQLCGHSKFTPNRLWQGSIFSPAVLVLSVWACRQSRKRDHCLAMKDGACVCVCACVRWPLLTSVTCLSMSSKFDMRTFTPSSLPLSFSSMIWGDFSTSFAEFSLSRVSVVKQSVQNQPCLAALHSSCLPPLSPSLPFLSFFCQQPT